MELVLLNGCKSKRILRKTRQVKNKDKSKKYIFYEDKEIQDIMKEFYQIKRNLIIYHNCIHSRRSCI